MAPHERLAWARGDLGFSLQCVSPRVDKIFASRRGAAKSSVGGEKSERRRPAMVCITAERRKALRLSLVSKGHKATVLKERLGSKTRIAIRTSGFPAVGNFSRQSHRGVKKRFGKNVESGFSERSLFFSIPGFIKLELKSCNYGK
ncbi:hypothetical protein FNW02_02270 [Komarekiella sp. 'clone 1']|uniref:Uncharacterized protein n=1 Tax=Komarekiella delphini-convector SJRDD-AB1 TaxID=2593771 RepID=A0AA40SSZ5_9NOST|nr:hypothetical protein [Komarekiella delphini-convector SJRDD-AB1]